jgi:hypothetical protein
MDLPIACSLSPPRLEERVALIGDLLAQGTVQPATRTDGFRARFRADPEIEARLRELVALESECCSFLSLTVSASDGGVLLDVTGPPAARELLERMLGAVGA